MGAAMTRAELQRDVDQAEASEARARDAFRHCADAWKLAIADYNDACSATRAAREALAAAPPEPAPKPEPEQPRSRRRRS
jgi:hypothetical protein